MYYQEPRPAPEPLMMACPRCHGEGQTVTVQTRTVREICVPCDGVGEVDLHEFAPDNGPDTWKEAEGIA